MESARASSEGQYFEGERSLYGQHCGTSAQTRGGSPRKGNCQALGRSKGGCGTKLHLLVDEAGRLLPLLLSPGQAGDHVYAPALADKAVAEGILTVVGDKGYDSDGLRTRLCSKAVEAVIPTRSNRRNRPLFEPERYKKRNLIERFIGWLKEKRRVATRYDKKSHITRHLSSRQF